MRETRLSLPAGALAGLCLFAAGCIPSLAGNEPREPNAEMPKSFGGDAPAEPGQKSSAAIRWRDFFASAELRSLIETALEKNQELNIQL